MKEPYNTTHNSCCKSHDHHDMLAMYSKLQSTTEHSLVHRRKEVREMLANTDACLVTLQHGPINL